MVIALGVRSVLGEWTTTVGAAPNRAITILTNCSIFIFRIGPIQSGPASFRSCSEMLEQLG